MSTMMQLPMRVDKTKVSRTRANLRAAKFWPTIGAAANATAIAGRNMLCMMRMPMPKPACASGPNGRKPEAPHPAQNHHRRPPLRTNEAHVLLEPVKIQGKHDNTDRQCNGTGESGAGDTHRVPRAPTGDQHGRQNGV